MNLQQMRYLCAIVDCGFNLSRAAKALHTSQPGISRQIRLLEAELRAELFVRQSNRVTTLTELGSSAVDIARRILQDIDNLRSVGADQSEKDRGSLILATTHVHARYILLPVVQQFKRRFPAVELSIRQGNPNQIVQLVDSTDADLGLCTEPTMATPTLARLPCYRFKRSVLTPKRHPLLRRRRITLADLASYPMINLDVSFAGGVAVMSAFQARNIQPNVVLSATDADVIKAYVAAGMGIATLPEVAFDAKRDKGLAIINANHLFRPSISYVWLNRHRHLRGYTFEFIAMLSRAWTRTMINRTMHSDEAANTALAIEPNAYLPAGH
jgi:LysR family transcriptional regulator, cys regulon transcriptional activator